MSNPHPPTASTDPSAPAEEVDAIDAIVALTDCDREAATAFVRKCYLAGIRDPKRLTFKGLQALARG